MSILRAFRLPFLILVSALALAGCIQTIGPVAASDPGSELDALAYGTPPDAGKSATRTVARRVNAPAPVVTEASKTSAPKPADFENSPGLLAVFGLDSRRLAASPTPAAPSLDANARIVAEPIAPRTTNADFENSPGLLAVFGLDNRQLAPPPRVTTPPLEAQARVAPPPVAALPPVIVRAPIAPPAATVVPVAVAVSHGPEYRLGAGDKLRVMVFGQEGLTNTYAIDAGGAITMPLIGRVSARGQTPQGLAADITARLRSGFIREPSVAVEIESYRPFFILGEVAAPGQYPYVPNMSVEAAIAIAGGFSPRARRDLVTVTHPAQGGLLRAEVPLGTPLNPGDTVMVSERWF